MIEVEIYPSRSARLRCYVVAKQLSIKLLLGCLGCFSFSCGRKQFGKKRFWKTMSPLKSREFTLITNKIVSFLNFSSVVWKENIRRVFMEKPPFSNFLERRVMMSPDYCKSVSIYTTCRGEKNSVERTKIVTNYYFTPSECHCHLTLCRVVGDFSSAWCLSIFKILDYN